MAFSAPKEAPSLGSGGQYAPLVADNHTRYSAEGVAEDVDGDSVDGLSEAGGGDAPYSKVRAGGGAHAHDEYVAPRRRSASSSSSDLEMDAVQNDDPLHRQNGPQMNGTSGAWTGSGKQGSWTDPLLHGQTMNEIDLAKEARRLGTQQFIEKTLVNSILIGLWYILSIAMSVYNKWMFSPGNLDFHFPLFSTSVHMIIQFFLASLVLWVFPSFRPEHGKVGPHGHEEDAPAQEQQQPSDGSKKPLITPWFYLTRVASCGAVTGLDIGLGNTSLKFISLTFFTMVKSSTLGFVLAFAIIFRLEKPSWKIAGIIAVMTIGVVMMVAGETAFNAIGFALLMSASFFSGLRWSLTQILLRRTPATSNPFSTLFFLTPIMFLTLFIIAIPSETFPALREGLQSLAAAKGKLYGMFIILFPGCIAFCMTSAEFALLKRTSVVTLSVCGIFKEVLTITAAGVIFGDELTPINISGLLVTILAILVYNWTRMRKMQKHEINKMQQERRDEEDAPIASAGQAVTNAHGAAGEDTSPTAEGGRLLDEQERRSSLATGAELDSPWQEPYSPVDTVRAR